MCVDQKLRRKTSQIPGIARANISNLHDKDLKWKLSQSMLVLIILFVSLEKNYNAIQIFIKNCKMLTIKQAINAHTVNEKSTNARQLSGTKAEH